MLNALATAASVISSKVGPIPPVVMRNLGLLPMDLRISSEISAKPSGTVVILVTEAPSDVNWVASQDAFVLTVLPSRSSLPMDNISTVQSKFGCLLENRRR
jgi:hypothetical protein